MSSLGSVKRLRPKRILAAIVAGLVIFVAVAIGPTWIRAWMAGLHYGTLTIAFLRVALGLFAATLAVGLLGTPLFGTLVARSRRRGRRRPVAARLLLLSVSCLVAVGLCEAMTVGLARWSRRTEAIIKAPEPPGAEYPASLPAGPKDELRVLVMGGSSARGVPFYPHLSIGEIIAWKLQEALPGRRVFADVLAYGGSPLEGMRVPLINWTKRPDIVLVYSGHNEFQARFAWSRTPDYYADDFAPRPEPPAWWTYARRSPMCRLILDAIEAQKLSIPPAPRVTRELIDRPCCTAQERADVLAIFRHRLEGMVLYAERLGAIPVLVIPPGNDAGFEPSRSVLAPSTSKGDREAFARDFGAARTLEQADPEAARRAYEALLVRQPGFAEAHYRLARLLRARKETAEARRHFFQARELDGMPMRCPGDFQDVYREIAAKHLGTILIDGPAVCESLSPDGLLDDPLFHDAHHPSLQGHAGLAQAVLRELHARRAFGWPEGSAAPSVELPACAEHFQLDAKAWSDACEGTSIFFDRTAYIRYDPAARLAKKALYIRAAKQILEGAAPETVGVPGLGTH